MSSTMGDGYTCPGCGMFVFWNTGHTCHGSSPPPPPFPFPQPFQPFVQPTQHLLPPFTLEDVRRIVREELEAFAKRQLEAEGSALPTTVARTDE